MSSERSKGVVLVGRKGDEYYFVDSVFRHDDRLAGCTGTVVCPVSTEYADHLLSADQVEDRWFDSWREYAFRCIESDCRNCRNGVDEEGCEDCGYQSLREFGAEIANGDGIDAMIDRTDQEYVDALNEHADLDDEAKYADCIGCGRIFGRLGLDDFDEVYNRKALVAILAYEDGATDYDYTRRVVYGD